MKKISATHTYMTGLASSVTRLGYIKVKDHFSALYIFDWFENKLDLISWHFVSCLEFTGQTDKDADGHAE